MITDRCSIWPNKNYELVVELHCEFTVNSRHLKKTNAVNSDTCHEFLTVVIVSMLPIQESSINYVIGPTSVFEFERFFLL